MPQQKVNVQTSFMSFVDHDYLVFPEVWICLCLGEQNPVGHQLDISFRAGLIGEADFTPNLFAPVDLEFLCNAAGNRECRDSPRLCAPDLALHSVTRFEAQFRNLGCFTRACFPSDHDYLVFLNGADNVVPASRDGKICGVGDLGQPLMASMAQ